VLLNPRLFVLNLIQVGEGATKGNPLIFILSSFCFVNVLFVLILLAFRCHYFRPTTIAAKCFLFFSNDNRPNPTS
jgi:hypothetical protein